MKGLYILLCLMCVGCSNNSEVGLTFYIEKTDEEWREELTPEQYRILRKAGTERPFVGTYTNHDDSGVYCCAGCNAELFTSDNKYHSGCGWPAFDDVIASSKVIQIEDQSLGMSRVEVLCAACGGHLGHIFPDGPAETTGMRYCINSVALEFQEKESSPSDK